MGPSRSPARHDEEASHQPQPEVLVHVPHDEIVEQSTETTRNQHGVATVTSTVQTKSIANARTMKETIAKRFIAWLPSLLKAQGVSEQVTRGEDRDFARETCPFWQAGPQTILLTL